MDDPTILDRPKKKLQCPICCKCFTKNFDLVQHERSHTGEKPFACSLCQKSFAQKSNMKKHLGTHRRWPDALRSLLPATDPLTVKASSTRYSCQFCTLDFDTYNILKKHILESHSNEKVFKCLKLNCSWKCSSLEELNLHQCGHSTENLCQVCGIKAGVNCQRCLQKVSRKWKCQICQSVFKREEALRWHEAVESHQHVCAVCGAIFKIERYLRRHLATHGDPFNCPTCGKLIKGRRTLKNHMALHDKSIFSCDKCSKQFTNFYTLRRHMTQHSKKPFICSYRNTYGCEKKFYRKDKFDTHVKTHATSNSSVKTVTSETQEINIVIYKVEESPEENFGRLY